jgi:hypothetical protein
MKLYIATTFANHPQASELEGRLAAHGHERTLDWGIFDPNAPGGPAPGAPREIALYELAGIYAADALIMLWPGKNGSHVELGVALALSKPVVMIGAPDTWDMTCPFYFHPRVTRMEVAYDDLDVRGSLVPLLEFLVLGIITPGLPSMQEARVVGA